MEMYVFIEWSPLKLKKYGVNGVIPLQENRDRIVNGMACFPLLGINMTKI
ncbi:hypothetical protein MTBPR1_140066 [Candidatus Terasakiella magnetica]|uniref:Uncharacterized protein n=1 Tax=Candidatus Terasakiella magnetica TaxID=1867952 RepID=A0A1C3RFB0_9PROT|nr:hypothetical protein MTBPR1_140066 [Candidatus Terasakiella magnetica]